MKIGEKTPGKNDAILQKTRCAEICKKWCKNHKKHEKYPIFTGVFFKIYTKVRILVNFSKNPLNHENRVRFSLEY